MAAVPKEAVSGVGGGGGGFGDDCINALFESPRTLWPSAGVSGGGGTRDKVYGEAVISSSSPSESPLTISDRCCFLMIIHKIKNILILRK